MKIWWPNLFEVNGWRIYYWWYFFVEHIWSHISFTKFIIQIFFHNYKENMECKQLNSLIFYWATWYLLWFFWMMGSEKKIYQRNIANETRKKICMIIYCQQYKLFNKAKKTISKRNQLKGFEEIEWCSKV